MAAVTSANAPQHHQDNVEALVDTAAEMVPPPPALNPLLARGKLKGAGGNKKKPKKQNRTDKIKEVYQVRQDEIDVATVDGADPAEEGEVLNLADQLLEQLGGQLNEDDDGSDGARTAVGSGAAPAPASDATQSRNSLAVPSESRGPSGAKSPTPSTGSYASRGSHSSMSAARERLHDLKEDFKDKMLPHRHQTANDGSGPAHGSGEGIAPGEIPNSRSGDGERKMGRQEARKLRKAQAMEQQRQEAEAEVLAANDNSAEAERQAISAQCRKLQLHIKEVEPDGHCMYSAIADQANFVKLVTERETCYSTRRHAAAYMRAHPDDFLPFLPSEVDPDNMMSSEEFQRYCDTVEKTSEWGGEPEIRALSLHYQAPIIVIQAGSDMVEHGPDFPRERALLISYHRKMYGLGEHYNSLRPSTHGAPHVLPPAPKAAEPMAHKATAV
ncbi:hypothetical protein JCM8202_003844 [Rhodotorula sphaerocarpa]